MTSTSIYPGVPGLLVAYRYRSTLIADRALTNCVMPALPPDLSWKVDPSRAFEIFRLTALRCSRGSPCGTSRM